MNYKRLINIALIVAFILLVPFAIMQFGIELYDPGSGYEKMNWTLFDFIVMGILLLTAGLGIDFAAQKLGKYRVIGTLAVIIIFFWLWAELAVGIFTNWGS